MPGVMTGEALWRLSAPGPAPSALTAVASAVAYVYAVYVLVAFLIFLSPNAPWQKAVEGAKTLDAQNPAWVNAPIHVRAGIDVALFALWATVHSTLARPLVKKTLLLGAWNRPVFVAQGAGLLHFLIAQWVPLTYVLWDVPKAWHTTLWCAFVGGAIITLTASFALDHFALFGLSDGFGVDINRLVGLKESEKDRDDASPALSSRWHYTLVAHPMMSGFLISFWCVPCLTLGHFLFSSLATVYILTATSLLEEPDLRRELGPAYEHYLRSVPSFCPFAPPRR
ncbi:hypothetical protein RI054_06g33620 [Pseudoscourfieldia marina]